MELADYRCGGLIVSLFLDIRGRRTKDDRTNTKYIRKDWIHYRDSNTPLFITQMTLPQLALILATLGIFVVYWSCQRQRRHLPPGPKKLPFIGNLLSIPTRAEWETFTHWGKKYSKITFLGLDVLPPRGESTVERIERGGPRWTTGVYWYTEPSSFGFLKPTNILPNFNSRVLCCVFLAPNSYIVGKYILHSKEIQKPYLISTVDSQTN